MYKDLVAMVQTGSKINICPPGATEDIYDQLAGIKAFSKLLLAPLNTEKARHVWQLTVWGCGREVSLYEVVLPIKTEDFISSSGLVYCLALTAANDTQWATTKGVCPLCSLKNVLLSCSGCLLMRVLCWNKCMLRCSVLCEPHLAVMVA